MKPIVFLVTALLSAVFATNAQLHFIAVSGDGAAAHVKAVNIVNEKTAVSDANGRFYLEAKADDMIVFPSERYEYKRYVVTEGDLKKGVVQIALIEKPVELEEVVILRDLNPEDLGLVRAGQKKYTVAERRLKQAGELKPMAMIGAIAGLSIPIDPIINAITGRTAMLKKDVVSEQKERDLEKLRALYPDAYYTDRLKVERAYIDGFRYYVVGEPDLQNALRDGEKAKIDFAMAGLAQKFNALHDNQPK